MKPFLTAHWNNLVNITYAVAPEALLPFLPRDVEPDINAGKAFVSLVPFVFRETKFHGMKIPFHISFSEMNLRCYVNYKNVRGIVFIKELISKFGVGFIANHFYNEHFAWLHLCESCAFTQNKIAVHYEIRKKGRKFFVDVASHERPFVPIAGSVDAYFKDLEYGFSQNKKGETLFFRVEHPVWEIYPISSFNVQVDFGELYGKRWEFLNDLSPINTTFSKGSAVTMMPHRPVAELAPAAKNLFTMKSEIESGMKKYFSDVLP